MNIQAEEIPFFLKPAIEGKNVGIISEAGCPAVADPGAQLVKLAHEKNIKVFPLVGPSSIILALMASGMNGQNFCFHGYLPIEKNERIKKLKLLEENAKRNKQTQIFIETPYRNNQLFEDILKTCNPDTRLCIATDLTLSTEFIITKTISKWKQTKPELHKRPAVFLLE
jgi:16S rRNA (cytidine1402-2'-O)-methyltransferase